MSEPTSCCRARGGYCERCDLLVGLDGLHVTAVDRDDGGRLVVAVESEPTVMGCPACGVVAHGHGRVAVTLVDAPAMGRPVRILWRKRRWVCPDPGCPVEDVRGAGRARRRSAVVVDGQGVPVGDRTDPPRARQRQRGPPPARHRVAHGVGRRSGRCCRRLDADHSRFEGVSHPRGRRARVAPRVHQADRGRRARPEGADRDGRPDPR